MILGCAKSFGVIDATPPNASLCNRDHLTCVLPPEFGIVDRPVPACFPLQLRLRQRNFANAERLNRGAVEV